MKTAHTLVALTLFATGLQAGTVQYQFNVNTSLIGAAPGYIEMQFDQANAATSLSAVATVTGFTSTGFTFNSALNAASSPSVTGNLSTGPLVIPNDVSAANYFDQGVTTFGGNFRFLLTLSGPAIGGTAPDPSEFLVFLFNTGFSPLVGPLSSGEVANIQINPNGTTTSTASSFVTVTPATTPVPEPNAIALATLAILTLTMRHKRRKGLQVDNLRPLFSSLTCLNGFYQRLMR